VIHQDTEVEPDPLWDMQSMNTTENLHILYTLRNHMEQVALLLQRGRAMLCVCQQLASTVQNVE